MHVHVRLEHVPCSIERIGCIRDVKVGIFLIRVQTWKIGRQRTICASEFSMYVFRFAATRTDMLLVEVGAVCLFELREHRPHVLFRTFCDQSCDRKQRLVRVELRSRREVLLHDLPLMEVTYLHRDAVKNARNTARPSRTTALIVYPSFSTAFRRSAYSSFVSRLSSAAYIFSRSFGSRAARTPYSRPKNVASMTRTTERGRCTFSGNSTVSRSLVIVRAERPASIPSCDFVRLPRTNSFHSACACRLTRRALLADFRQALQMYRTTPFLFPFLTTAANPQDLHFFSHILQAYLKYSPSMAIQRSQSNFSSTNFFH